MIYSGDRGSMRDVFFNAWEKHDNGQVLEPMDAMILRVIEMHPEYKKIVSNRRKNRDRDHFPEAGDTNPFFHMGMHMTVLEQIGSDQPPGVRACFEAVLSRVGDEHDATHVVIECLSEWLAQAQAPGGQQLDPADYLTRLKRIAGPSI